MHRVIESVEGLEQAVLLLGCRLQENGTKCWRERQGIQSAQHRRGRNGQGKLLVELSRDATDQGRRNEYRQEHQYHTHNRSCNLAHCFLGNQPHVHLLALRLCLIEQSRDVLYHHNRIVHHNGNGQYQAKQGQRIDRESQQGHDGQGTNQRYRNGDARYQHRTPILKEEEHHKHHQDGRFDERLHYLGYGVVHHFGCIECHLVPDALRKGFGQLLHAGFHSLRHIKRIGARELIYGYTGRRLAFQSGNDIVFLAPQFDVRHVLQPENPSAFLHPKDDFTKLIGCSQATFHIQGILERILARTSEGLTYITGRHLHVLRLDGGVHLLGTQPTDAHRLRVEPNSHGIIARTHHIHRTYPRHTGQLVHQVEVGIVGQIQSVIKAIARQGQHHDDVR